MLQAVKDLPNLPDSQVQASKGYRV